MLNFNIKRNQIHQQFHETQQSKYYKNLPSNKKKVLTIDLNKNLHQVQYILKKMYFLYSPKDFNHSHRSLESISTNNTDMKPEQILRHICFEYPNKQNGQYLSLYLPAFLRLQIIRINELQVSTHKGCFNGLIHYDIDITNLPDVMIDYIKQNLIWKLHFQQNYTWQINKSNSKLQRQKIQKIDDRILLRCLFYSIFQTRVLTDIQWTPNQTANMLFSIKAQSLIIQKSESTQYKKMIHAIKQCSQQKMQSFQQNGIFIRFNFMDYMYELERQPRKYNLVNEEAVYQEFLLVKDMAQVMHGPYLEYGPYKLAEREIKFEYSYKQQNTFEKIKAKKLRFDLNESYWVKFLQSKTPKVKEDKLQRDISQNIFVQNPVEKQFKSDNYCHSICNAHFMIPMARKPLSPFIKLFLPSYLFALLALSFFWYPLGGRIIDLTSFFFAFFPRIDIFNQQIHNLPKLSYIQKIQYILTIIPILAGIHTFVGIVRDDYKFQWQTDPFFLISLFLFVIATLFCLIFLVRYYFFRINKESIAFGKKIDLKINQWIIPACYNQFSEVKKKRIYEAYSC